jgi:hypothetical protein
MGVRAAFIVLAFIASLMGCAREDPAQLAAADNQQCISIGTTPGTPAYTDCRLKLERIHTLQAQSPPPPTFKDCPTEASGLSCIGPTHGR